MLLQLTRFKPSLVQTRFNFNPSWYALRINQTTCSAFTWASVLPQPFCVSHPASPQTPSTLKSFFRFLLCLYSLLATLCTCGVHFPASISLACVSSRVLFFSSFNSQLFHLFCQHCLSTASPPPGRLHSFLLAFFGQGPAMQLNETSHGSARPSCQPWFESTLRIAQL